MNKIYCHSQMLSLQIRLIMDKKNTYIPENRKKYKTYFVSSIISNIALHVFLQIYIELNDCILLWECLQVIIIIVSMP